MDHLMAVRLNCNPQNSDHNWSSLRTFGHIADEYKKLCPKQAIVGEST